jgi:hypothetical protein
MESLHLIGPMKAFKGGRYQHPGMHKYTFQMHVLDKLLHLGSYAPEAVESGARLYDALQLLLYGPFADANFEWSSYSQGDVAAAVSFLQAKGVDVHRAVVHARSKLGSGAWVGTRYHQLVWEAQVPYQGFIEAAQKVVSWCGLPCAVAAAHQADRGLLAIQGLGCTTNFPASQYSKLQLEEAGQYAVSKGFGEARVGKNLAAVEQVCCEEAVLVLYKCAATGSGL